MKKLTYVDGDATDPQGNGPKIIIHCCNDIGAWGAGFVLALSKKWDAPEKHYRTFSSYKLGEVNFINVEEDLLVCNMIGQHGVGPDEDGDPPIRYKAIMLALQQVNGMAKAIKATVHCPKFGSDLAGGDWNLIEALLKEIMEVPVTVYNFVR